jgi:hypothetical protein
MHFRHLRKPPFAEKGRPMDVITEAEALAAEAARYAAQTTGDFATLEKLIGDDLVYYHSSSVIDTKKSFIASQTSGNVK